MYFLRLSNVFGVGFLGVGVFGVCTEDKNITKYAANGFEPVTL